MDRRRGNDKRLVVVEADVERDVRVVGGYVQRDPRFGAVADVDFAANVRVAGLGVVAMLVVILALDPLDYGDVSVRPRLEGKALRNESVALGAADSGEVATREGKLVPC